MCLCIFVSRMIKIERVIFILINCFAFQYYSSSSSSPLTHYIYYILYSNNFVFIIIRCCNNNNNHSGSMEEKIFLIKHDTTSCKLTFEKRLNMQQLIFHTNFSHYEENFPSALLLLNMYALVYIDLKFDRSNFYGISHISNDFMFTGLALQS